MVPTPKKQIEKNYEIVFEEMNNDPNPFQMADDCEQESVELLCPESYPASRNISRSPSGRASVPVKNTNFTLNDALKDYLHKAKSPG